MEKVSEENRNYTKHGFIQEFFDRRETIDNAKHIDPEGWCLEICSQESLDI